MEGKGIVERNLFLSFLFRIKKDLTSLQWTKQRRAERKQYAKKAIKNVFGSEVNAFESLAKKAEEGSYNHMKLLLDFAYGDDKEDTSVRVQAPIINFFGDSIEGKKLKDKIIDVTPKDE